VPYPIHKNQFSCGRMNIMVKYEKNVYREGRHWKLLPRQLAGVKRGKMIKKNKESE